MRLSDADQAMLAGVEGPATQLAMRVVIKMAEAIRLGTAPVAILVEEPDEILVLGAIVADHLYGRTCPVLVLAEATRRIATGDQVRITRDGTVTIIPSDR